MTVHELVISAGAGALGGAAYGGLTYARRRTRDTESFDPTKFGATVILGAVIGTILALSGTSVTQGTIQEQLVLYAGAVTLVEGLLKWARAELQRKNE